MNNNFYSNGKLLLSGEYVVLDGAWALAFPTKFGQSLTLKPGGKFIHWKSFDEQGNVWFEENFSTKTLRTSAIGDAVPKSLSNLLQQARLLNPQFLEGEKGIEVETHLDFPRDWGLGSSSTLVNNIAQWAGVDPYQLLQKSFGGSGYDIAAAQNNGPILYRINEDGSPEVKKVEVNWDFTDSLFFIYLNQKQNSREGIKRYSIQKKNEKAITRVSEMSRHLINCQTLSDFEDIITTHEQVISSVIDLPSTKEQLFKEYPHAIKSLGAWGGDFILAVGDKAEMDFFKDKGYHIIIPFKEMVL